MIVIKELLKDYLGTKRGSSFDREEHLRSAAEWIVRAHESGNDSGVSRMYSLFSGWGPSYPETTGYIIPTMIEYGKKSKVQRFITYAVKMADWTVECQLKCGGIMAGTVDAKPKVPTIFNTGQNLFGWIAAYNETNDEKYLISALKAAKWLVSNQNIDGSWTKYCSPFAKYELNTYNIRSAWGIAKLYKLTGDELFLKSCLKNANWVVSQQNEVGWFKNNCLTDNENPLTHTIGYTLEGLLEIGVSFQEPIYIDAVTKAAEALINVQLSDGSLKGRYNDRWEPNVRWVCLTGLAQIAICWWRLYEISGQEHFKKAAVRADEYLMSKQDIRSPVLGIRGGIKGSFPVNGEYCAYQYPNWAAKFFMDSLMLECRNS